ncbi:glycosyltransferase [Cytobacillus sp. S13-E01]|uniref:glycosyltransferase n=1 Tax=Cytobacillus sp. S13-E01 TaxID=3031326 RepID=UPI0023D87DBB|nr:glycosyltransferase [Cytobacillus sp. S13-E01]MDF0727763.1 glycosyltransferase [Cytobacillus sp. S13-E01]
MKKDILISVYNMEIGGIERSLINMLESFNYDNYNVDLLIFNHTGELMDFIPETVNILPQIDQYSVYRRSIVQCLREGHYSTSVARILGKFMANIKARNSNFEEGSAYIQMQLALKYSTIFLPKIEKIYDLAISYAWPHDIIAKKVRAKKKMAWIHTDYSKLEIDNKIDFEIWSRFDCIASISEECSKSFVNIYPLLKSKVKLIENINSPNYIKRMIVQSEANNEWNCNSNTFNILSVGRLSHAKGYDLAIKALKELHNRGLTNINWYVIGYGTEETALKDLIKQYDLKDHFILLGKKNNPYPYMKACDLYVQPSRYEGKAVTVTEAKIVGKPILTTKYPTSASQIEDGIEGIICDLSVSGLVDGVERLFKNHELRNSLIKNVKEKDYSNINELNKLYKIIGS